jgi:glutathione S-transferase
VNCRTPPMIHEPPPMRPRDRAREQEIMELALKGANRHGLGDAGLSRFADNRALPGGIRTSENWRRHSREELADCCNYLTWDTEDHYEAYLAGDEEAGKRVAENLGALGLLVKLWAGLPER